MSGGRKEVPEQQTVEMEAESQRKHEESPLKPLKSPCIKGCEELSLCQHLVLCHGVGIAKCTYVA